MLKLESGSGVVQQRVASGASSRIAQLDGLRGLACLLVVMHHCYLHCGRYGWPGFAVQEYTLEPTRLLYFGYSGVELFFILSGFCLTWPILIRNSPKVGWGKYFWRRVWRIAPPYIASVLLLALIQTAFHYTQFQIAGASTLHTDLPTLAQLLVGISFYGTVFNPSYWSLVLEWRWYFLFPLLLIFFRRAGIGALLLLTGILSCVSFWFLMAGQIRLSANFGPVLFYLPLFALGMIAAYLHHRHPGDSRQLSPNLIRLGIIVSVGLLVLLVPREPQGWGSYYRIIPFGLLYFCLLLFALRDPIGQRVFSTRIMVGLGIISYSLYLVHEPIVHYVYHVSNQFGWPPYIQLLFYQGILVPFCIGVGILFYFAVERWFVSGIAQEKQSTVEIESAKRGPIDARPAPLVPLS